MVVRTPWAARSSDNVLSFCAIAGSMTVEITNVPRPTTCLSAPSPIKVSRARRKVPRLTPSCLANSGSGGKR